MNQDKFLLDQLIWLAKRLRKGKQDYGKADRPAVIKEFKKEFPKAKKLTPGKLAALYRTHGGNQESFIRDYESRELPSVKHESQMQVPPAPVARSKRAKRAVVVPPPAPVIEEPRVWEAKRDQLIAQALLDWDPYNASFATVYALAAKTVNEKLGTAYQGIEIQSFILKSGGTLEFLYDCGIDKAAALRAFELGKQVRIKRN